ncbi:condensation domain-containing protein, partial [Massilia sp. BJB1822]|uniref:condensation domain-containing protein n=1 Tax=Massilia sp. BJB1822 TaxID=2744470 RepID=UPI001592FECB
MMRVQDDLRRAVGALLDGGQDGLDEHEDLLLLGLDSIRIMSLIGTLRHSGVRLRFDELVDNPTLAAWWALVEARRGSLAPPVAPAGAAPAPAAPFELTPVQHAYWIGREADQELGGVGCHFYAEFDGRAVQPARLEQAVLGLQRRHAQLRARFLEDGTQLVDADGSWTSLTVHDARGGADEVLASVRDALSHRRLDVAAGQVFDVQLALRDGDATRLYISVDLLVADVKSIQIFLRDLAQLYEGEAPKPLDYGFADYLQERGAHAEALAEARDYWLARLPTLPGGPELPLARDPREAGRPQFRRREHLLGAVAWQRFAGQARRHGVTPAMALAAAFTEVLAAWSATPHFLLNLPVFDRHSTRPEVEHMVADFTNLILLEVDARGQAGFAERAVALQARFRADISHAEYSGIDVLRKLAARDGGRVAAPVVFACNLSGGDLVDPLFQRSLGRPAWGISQTPQVWLDHQVTELDGGVHLNWDAVEDLFPAGVLDAMFSTYCGLLARLTEGDWSLPALAGVVPPAAQRLVRERVNATAAPQSAYLLHQAFFEQAAREPARTALLWGESGSMNYGELALRARRIAAHLRRHGLQPGQTVALTLPKGPEQIAAVLGVLWAGGVYVPVGIDQPAARG